MIKTKPKRYRHIKSDKIYLVLDENVINATNSADSVRMVFYMSPVSEMTFVRNYDEFHDGRFELVDEEE